jgi:acetyl esterase/lipase
MHADHGEERNMQHTANPILLAVLMTAFQACASLGGPTYDEPVYGVDVILDVVYGKGVVRDLENQPRTLMKDLLLDAYLPADCPNDAKPVLLLVHGGGFRGGDKRAEPFRVLGRSFAARGFACFSIDYRLYGDNPPVPREYETYGSRRAAHAAFVDTKRAVRWVRAHKEEYGLDPDRIAALGGSAGAVSVLAVGLSDPEDFMADGPDDPAIPLNHPEESSQVQAVVSCWGTSRPVPGEFDANDPPIMVFHGTHDQNPNTSFTEAERIRDKCAEAGIPCMFYGLEGQGHGAWRATYDGKELPELVRGFLQRHMLK